ncbi:MAG: SgcJ/EcaC family oxidoreductase [Planctomycetia bacterium]|nr:SgcJ/EcaC family oxidoreductase [Planctomycetia bacterium]
MNRRIALLAVLAAGGLYLALGWAQTSSKTADDEQAIRKAVEAYSAAFNKGDVPGVLAYWTVDADFVDEDGKLHKGREALTALFKSAAVDLKGHQLKLHTKSLRFLKPDVALEDGEAEMKGPDGETNANRYTAVWVKADGKWQIASARDLPSDASEVGQRKLRELDWLIGTWTHQDDKASVQVVGRWVLSRSYLQLETTAKVKGEELAVSQMIGWDPVNQQLRTWFFDSRGGHGDGWWTRDGNTWSVELDGVLADGRLGYSLNHWKYVDEKHATWQATHRSVDGQPLPDVEVKFTRAAK